MTIKRYFDHGVGRKSGCWEGVGLVSKGNSGKRCRMVGEDGGAKVYVWLDFAPDVASMSSATEEMPIGESQ